MNIFKNIINLILMFLKTRKDLKFHNITKIAYIEDKWCNQYIKTVIILINIIQLM